jgi:hypothetical protein
VDKADKGVVEAVEVGKGLVDKVDKGLVDKVDKVVADKVDTD